MAIASWYKLKNPRTITEAREEAGLTWGVKRVALITALNERPAGAPVNHVAIVRETDLSILGVVGKKYQPLQNDDAFDWFQPIISEGKATLESAGSFRGGKTVFILAKITAEGKEVISGDRVDAYILLSNSYDGTAAVRVGFIPIRILCWNTLVAAHEHKDSKLLRVWHKGNMTATLAEVRGLMEIASKTFQATAEQYRNLAKVKISKEDFDSYVKIIFPPPGKAGPAYQKKVATLESLFDKEPTNNYPEMKGTLWAAYNAVTAYLTHSRGKKTEGRNLHSLWFGQKKLQNEKAMEIAIQMAA